MYLKNIIKEITKDWKFALCLVLHSNSLACRYALKMFTRGLDDDCLISSTENNNYTY